MTAACLSLICSGLAFLTGVFLVWVGSTGGFDDGLADHLGTEDDRQVLLFGYLLFFAGVALTAIAAWIWPSNQDGGR